jgi:aspartyl protease family protein
VARRGHFYAETRINGRTITTMIDTGASIIALSAEDAERLGLFPHASDRKARLQTANGQVEANLQTLREVQIGGLTVQNVDAAIMPRGALKGSLLGMSFLGRLRGYEVNGDRLTLRN